MSEEAKDLIRQFQKGRTRSPETRARMSVAAKLRSEEHYANSVRQKLVQSQRKDERSQTLALTSATTEAFRNLGLINLGRPKSIETRLKMAEARRGEKSIFEGGLSKETIANAKTPCRTVEYRLWKESVFNQVATSVVGNETCSGPLQPIHFNLGPSFQSCDTSSPMVSACANHHQKDRQLRRPTLALTKAA